ncbi:MAG: toll/interleukin-1 receptor domain-containing protein [Deltaproteobacteria bacterium]|nr:toll/interleukin-1 receptor domain-containing protein [Deltaproteobacteria bacterium]
MGARADISTMISYRSTDLGFAEELLGLLRDQGIFTWIDREGIKPGTQWRDELFRALKQCRALVVVLSRDYLSSDNCRMEVFIARSLGHRIVPVMIEDCFSVLSEHEETKGLEDTFMMRLHSLNVVGLQIDRSEALRRVVNGVLATSGVEPSLHEAYVSYSGNTDGEFATEVARDFSNAGISSWVATQNVHVGDNWRDAQARAMMGASSHVVVLDENIVRSPVLRTEILLSEALGLSTYTVLPPRLEGEYEKIEAMMHDLDSGDQTYRRLTQVQYVPRNRLTELHPLLSADIQNRTTKD